MHQNVPKHVFQPFVQHRCSGTEEICPAIKLETQITGCASKNRLHRLSAAKFQTSLSYATVVKCHLHFLHQHKSCHLAQLADCVSAAQS